MPEMLARHAVLSLLLLMTACAAPPRVADTEGGSGRLPPATGPEIWAYAAHWTNDAWRLYDLRAFRRLLFFDLVVGGDGGIADAHGWPDAWNELRAASADAGVPLDPVVSVLEREVFSAVFSSRDARARLLAETVRVARASAGVHLDIEVEGDLPRAEVDGFREFLRDLRAALDAPPRKILTAFVLARNALYEAPDLALLDAVVAQGYDVHWRTAPVTGPISVLDGESPAAWRTAAASFGALGVEPSRLLFSTALYAYEWPAVSDLPGAPTRGAAEILSYAPLPPSASPAPPPNALARSAQHGLRREAATLAPWYAFRDRDGWRQGWFDDPVSLAPRLDFVRRGGYRGVALFVLGYDERRILETIEARFRAGSATSAGASPAASR